jgi:hypothetical protein
MNATATKMMTPAELRQFRADVATVQSSLDSTLTYLAAEERLAEAAETMRTRWQCVLECGTALRRIHETRSYRDAHKDWTAFCRELKLSTKHSYRIMKCTEILATIPEDLVGKIDMPLSFRLVADLGKLDEEERVAMLSLAANAPDADTAREMLRSSLKGTRKRAGAGVGEMDRVRRLTGKLEDFFCDFDAEKDVRPIIQQLLELAERILAANRSAAA